MIRKRRFSDSRFARPVAVSVVLVVMGLAITGCGDGRPSRVPVSGQVLIDGNPLTHGYVRFVHPTSRPSIGQLDSSGRFTLSCFERDDGAVLGVHRVEVDAKKPIGEDQIQWHAPKKYAKSATSGIEVEITEPTDSLTINISWDGQKGPFTERL